MRSLAFLALAVLAACSPPAGSEGSDEGDAAALPSNPSLALLTRYVSSDAGQAVQAGPFAPRDDCSKVDGTFQFRVALADAVVARDTEALVALSDPNIDLGFGGDFGHADLRRQLAESNLWEELEKVLELGCAVADDGALILPWYFAQDMGDADPFQTLVVTGDRVPVFATADGTLDNETPIALLSWQLVGQDSWADPSATRQPIVLGDGRKGYMLTEQLRSVIDYRLIARQQEGMWILSGIYAGD